MSAPHPPREHTRHTRRMPSQSLFYDRVMPILFVALAIVMIVLIGIAAGVLLGIVHYQ